MAQDDPFEVAAERYKDLIPRECFLYDVPLWLQSVPDNTIFPSCELRAGDGFQWVKASKFREFIDACKGFAKNRGSGSTLRVLVMPYLSPYDASMIIELLEELPEGDENNDEDAAVPMDVAEPDVHPNPDAAAAEGENDAAGKGEDDALWDMKSVIARFEDIGVYIKLSVMNFEFLDSKATMYDQMTESFDSIMRSMSTSEKALKLFFEHFPIGNREGMSETYSQAKRDLIFAMVDEGKDPHDVILELFPGMHDDIYQQGCVHCDPHINYVDEVDPPETLERLKDELDAIGFGQHEEDGLSVQEAQLELMSALGNLEQYHITESVNNVRDVHRTYMDSVRKTMDEHLYPTLEFHSVLGVYTEEESSDSG